MLDIAIVLCVVFVVVATLASGVWEFITRFLRLRERFLYANLKRLFDFSAGTDEVQQRAADRFAKRVLRTYRRQRALRYSPDHIPNDAFASVVLELQEQQPAGLKRLLARMQASDPTTSQHDQLVAWFADSMRDASQRWRFRSRFWLFAIGLVLAIAVNVDVLRISEVARVNPALSAAIAGQAQAQAMAGAGEDAAAAAAGQVGLATAIQQINQLAGQSAMVGWSGTFDDNRVISVWEFPRSLIGWLLTACAAGMGAPFWLDVMRSLLRMRRGQGNQATSAAAPAPTAAGDASGRAPDTAVADAPAKDFTPIGDFKQPFEGFETSLKARAYWLSRLSSMVYDPLPEVVATLQSWDVEIRAFPFEDPGAGTQGLVVAYREHRMVIFRGTEQSVDDWATDIRIWTDVPTWLPAAETQRKRAQAIEKRQRNGDRCQRSAWTSWAVKLWAWLRWQEVYPAMPDAIGVHAGFNQALIDPLWQRIVGLCAWRANPADTTELKIWFAGHSLGGALATLGAARALAKPHVGLRLVDAQPVVQRISAQPVGSDAPKSLTLSVAGVVTVGQPRVGNAKFVQWYQSFIETRELDDGQATDKPLHVRVIVGMDPVTMVPMRDIDTLLDVGGVTSDQDGGYGHAGVFWRFEGQPTPIRGTGDPSRVFDFAGLAIDERSPLSIVADHSSVGYVDHIEGYWRLTASESSGA